MPKADTSGGTIVHPDEFLRMYKRAAPAAGPTVMEGCADAWRGAREQCGRVAHWLLHGRGSRSASGRHRDLPDASSPDDLQVTRRRCHHHHCHHQLTSSNQPLHLKGLEKSTAVLLQGLGDSTAILMRSDQESAPVIRGGRGTIRALQPWRRCVRTGGAYPPPRSSRYRVQPRALPAAHHRRCGRRHRPHPPSLARDARRRRLLLHW